MPQSIPCSQEACCHNIIIDSGVMCSTTSAAPCIIDRELCINIAKTGLLTQVARRAFVCG